MKFTKSISDIIRERSSWRTYSGEPLKNEVRAVIMKLIKKRDFKSPFSKFSGSVRFELLSIPEFEPLEKQKLGTYGVIEGAQEFIIGAVESSKYDKEHFGYVMESIILAATDLGLGTCWLGGTFNRSLFSAKINKKENETIPAITPIGYPVDRNSREKMIRSYARADKRFPWNKLFFDGDFSTPLLQEKVKKYFPLIENVRLAPSAGNFQPWRIIKESNKNVFHFYVVYSRDKMGINYNVFKAIDIGIAVNHFDLSTKELGIRGYWDFNQPEISSPEDFQYSISWHEEG